MRQAVEPEVPRFSLLVVILASAAVCLPVLAFNFNPASDDYFFLLLNPMIRDTSANGLLNILTSMSTRYHQFQPVTFLSFWLEYSLWGLRPAPYFAVQLLLHLINVVLVYAFVRAVSGQELLALITALLFGIHPLQVDTLALIYERKKILSTAMALLAILQYIRWKESPNYFTYVTICLFFCLALLADEPWLVLPFVLVAVDYYLNEPFSWSSIFNKTPLIILSILIAGFTLKGQGSAGMTTPYHFGSFESQCELVVLIFTDFILSFFFPLGLATGYTYSPMELHSIRMLGAVALLAVLIALFAIAWKKKWRSICFGLVWFSVCIAPFSQIIPYQIVRADHYMYYALIGLAILLASAVVSIFGKERRRKVAIPILGVITIVLGPVTLNHLQHYQTPYKYIQRFVDTQGWAPSVEIISARVHEFYGNYELAERSLLLAIENFEEPFKSGLRLKLANLYLKAQIQLIPPDSPSWGPAKRFLMSIQTKESEKDGNYGDSKR
jgi:protein O-mannosyl-transferase